MAVAIGVWPSAHGRMMPVPKSIAIISIAATT